MTVLQKSTTLHFGVLALLAIAFFVLPTYHAGNLSRIMVLAVYAMGFNILFGYTGLLSLGHAMFFAAGMYGFGLATNLWGLPLPLAFLIGIIAAGTLAAITGFLALRTIGVGFMIVTLMFAQTTYLVILYYGEYTRGDDRLNTAYCFDFLSRNNSAGHLHSILHNWIEAGEGAPTWALGNHDFRHKAHFS